MSMLLVELRKHKNNRGMMADLRCVLVKRKRHRAWPVLNRLGVDIDDDISAFVAGLFATHPEETSIDNFGTTCKLIESKRGDKRNDDNKLTQTERRFQHLLAADTRAELYSRILRMVLMAKSLNVPVNYEKLETDLNNINSFSDRKKTEWATAFWAQGSPPVVEEDV